MAAHTAESSPQLYARIGGVLYLIIIVIGLFGEVFVRDKLVVAGDPTATANNIRASEFLWRLSLSAEIFMLMCAVGLTLIFYMLLRPAGTNLIWLAIFFNLVSIVLDVANKSRLLTALFLLGDADYLNVFEPRQLHALAYISIRSHAHGFAISLIFFACFCLVIGLLILRSGYFPRYVGALMQVAGVSYLINSFALLLAPKLAGALYPAILVPAFIGELAVCLWLLVKGVNVSKWQDHVRRQAISS